MANQENTVPIHQALLEVFDLQQRAFRQYAPLGHAKRIEALDTLLQSVLVRRHADRGNEHRLRSAFSL